MTAVDHAELKRVAEGATLGKWETSESGDVGVAGSDWGVSYPSRSGTIASLNDGEYITNPNYIADSAFIAAANPAVVLALLSEIEGLKAENIKLRTIMRGRDALAGLGLDGDKLAHEVAEQASRGFIAEKARADEAERQLADLRTQAPDSWRPDREAVARIVDALAFGVTNDPATDSRREAQRDTSLAKADAILALRPQTAESGK